MSRADRAREIVGDLKVRPVPRVKASEHPRFLLVQQYADAGRGIQHAVAFGDDVDQLFAAAMREVWDGWLPTDVHDLDTGTAETITVTIAPRSRPRVDAVTIVDVDGRDAPYLFRLDDDAQRFVRAVGAARCSTYDGLIVEPEEAAAVIEAEAEPDEDDPT